MSIILFRPRSSRFASALTANHKSLRDYATDSGVSVFELCGELATWQALFEFIDHISKLEPHGGCIVLAMCDSHVGKPTDDFDEPITLRLPTTRLERCQFLFVGGDVDQTAVDSLLTAGVSHILSFRGGVRQLPGFEGDLWEAIEQDIMKILQHGSLSDKVIYKLRQALIDSARSRFIGTDEDQVRSIYLLKNSDSMQCSGPKLQTRHRFKSRRSALDETRRRGGLSFKHHTESCREPKAELRTQLASRFAYLYMSVVLVCLAVSIFDDADLGVKLLVSFQASVAAPLGVAIGYFFGKSRALPLRESYLQ